MSLAKIHATTIYIRERITTLLGSGDLDTDISVEKNSTLICYDRYTSSINSTIRYRVKWVVRRRWHTTKVTWTLEAALLSIEEYSQRVVGNFCLTSPLLQRPASGANIWARYGKVTSCEPASWDIELLSDIVRMPAPYIFPNRAMW